MGALCNLTELLLQRSMLEDRKKKMEQIKKPSKSDLMRLGCLKDDISEVEVRIKEFHDRGTIDESNINTSIAQG